MEQLHTYQLADFISELSAFSFSDVLVNLDKENRAIFSFENENSEQFVLPFSNRFNQIYKIALQNKKVSDIKSLCAAKYLLQWKIKDRLVETPLFLIPTHCLWNKVKQEFSIDLLLENALVNPFIIHHLKKEFQLDFPILDDLSLEETKEQVLAFLMECGFEVTCENFQALGNFHYHRYEIIKDLEEILNQGEPNDLVKTILGEAGENENVKLNLSKLTCFESDTDQEAIFEAFETDNCVVQGPPGTGKSQVLSNLISKLLMTNERHLIVSEKKTALDVLEKKLQTKNLHHFLFSTHSQSKASDFVMKLKSTWNFLEQNETKYKPNLRLSEQYLQQIQLTFDKLNASTFWGEKSLESIQEFATTAAYEKLTYISNLPNVKEWNKLKTNVDFVYQQLKEAAVLGKIRQSFLTEKDHLDEHISQLEKDLFSLTKYFEIHSFEDLVKLNRKALRLQVLANEQTQKYSALLDSDKELKKYQKVKKQYTLLKTQAEFNEKELSVWKKTPSLSEVESWLQSFEKSSWFAKRKLTKYIQSHLKIAQVDLKILLSNSLLYLKQEKEYQATIIVLQELGVENPLIEINIIDYVLSEKNKISSEEWEELKALKNKDKQLLLSFAKEINTLIKALEDFLYLDNTDVIEEVLNSLKVHCADLNLVKSYLLSLPNSVYKNLNLCKNTEAFEQLILKSTWVQFASLYPDLAQFTGEKLAHVLDQLEKEEVQEHDLFASEIIAKQKTQFVAYHKILQSVSTKLNAEEKELKKALKTGKAILVKEFSKSKQHKSIRELLTSEARLWIDVLTPIHLSTPASLSKNIPLEKAFYTSVIFDEASQIPLANAIGSLYRSKRTLIAGDGQQMSPSSFFSSMKSGVDLLHQASYYLKQKSLKHHYRSIYPELISFSNKHFYQNELIVYPSANQSQQALNWHYVPNGVFDERQNKIEAKQVALEIEKAITSDKTIGVVAFSEHQLSCIWKELNVKTYVLLEQKIKNNQIFFKALEQVQGEECDILIISLGYGKNKEGDFHLRFGPLNQANGSKRLNVLFTRAKEQIHFFSSVRSSDFQLSANEAINLLRLYLAEIENQAGQKEMHLPFDLKAEVKQNKMSLKKIQEQIKDASELKTFHQVMKNRGWKVEFGV